MQTLETNRFVEIIMTRVTIPLGGHCFLPARRGENGALDGSLMDNLEVLTQPGRRQLGPRATNDLLRNRIKIRSLNFMRGGLFSIVSSSWTRRRISPEADESADHARRPRHEGGLPRQYRPDRHTLSHGNDVGPDLCCKSFAAGRTLVTSPWCGRAVTAADFASDIM